MIENLKNVWNFASEVHKTQFMPSSDVSYLNHLGSVMLELFNAHLIEPIENIELALSAGILHDTKEDQGVLLTTLIEKFGEDTSSGVDSLSKNDELSKEEAMRDSLKRIKEQPKSIWCVKLCDRISNLSNIPAHWTNEKKQKYAKEAEIILNELGSANFYLANRLNQKIQSLKV